MAHYNLNKLIKIVLLPCMSNNRFVVNTKKTFLGIVIQEEGVFDKMSFCEDKKVNIESWNSHFVKNNIVWEKPRVIIDFEGGYDLVRYFETFKEAEEYHKDIMHKTNTKFIRSY